MTIWTSRLLLLCMCSAAGTCVMAADKSTVPQSPSQETTNADLSEIAAPYVIQTRPLHALAGLQNPFVSSGFSFSPTSGERDAPNSRTTIITSGDTCLAMRIYKVKPKEKFAEGESESRGYTECERASAYKIRAADGVEDASIPTK